MFRARQAPQAIKKQEVSNIIRDTIGGVASGLANFSAMPVLSSDRQGIEDVIKSLSSVRKSLNRNDYTAQQLLDDLKPVADRMLELYRRAGDAGSGVYASSRYPGAQSMIYREFQTFITERLRAFDEEVFSKFERRNAKVVME